MARGVVFLVLVLNLAIYSHFVTCCDSNGCTSTITPTFNLPPPLPQCPSHNHCPRTWNYTNSPAWGTLCKPWAQCSSGLNQSPLDLSAPAKPTDCRSPRFDIDYSNTSTCLFNTGNYFVFPVNKTIGNTFTFNGIQYVLSKVEFHSPSEHLVMGTRYDMEVIFYHDSPIKGGKKLATSIFFNRRTGANDSNPWTSPFLEQFVYDLPEFSDCTCGDKRTQFLSGPDFYGVNEECDEGTRNSNTSPPFSCCRANCTKARCGDGVIDETESCDNGTRNSNSTPGACRLNCCLPFCSDNVTDPGEQCDDGNLINGDGCSSICVRECGNGALNPSLEQCDNGTLNSNTAPNACRANCRLPFCGDGVVDAGEQCDNGTWMGIDPGQCRPNCTLPNCGDGITDPNEDCDNGLSFNGPNSNCSTSCRTNCGDGIIQTGEQCDEGGLNSNYPDAICRTNCLLARCGDGIIDTQRGEQCDSVEVVDPLNPNSPVYGNRYCSANCTQLCGSGVFNPNLECDHGCYNADLPNKCRTNCENPICGDGIIDVTEECDTANSRSNSAPNACRMNCTLPKCGDYVVDNGEQCDLGVQNGVPGSGCSSKCQNQCGNGVLDLHEQCDNGTGNANTSDSCRVNCRLPKCGDGIIDSCEQCDDGARNSDTAPNACRTDCTRPYCGDGIIDFNYGEKCDFGRHNSDTKPDGCSLFCVPNYCRQRCLNESVDLNLAIPYNQSAFTYSGSLPYPPCTDDINWLVFESVQPISDFQYARFSGTPYGLYGSRVVQPQGTRKIRSPFVCGPPKCGNGIQEPGEQCDLGFLLNSDWQANRCRSNCSLPYCGDGVTDRGEECDDGHEGSHRCTSLCNHNHISFNPFATKPWSYKSCQWSFLSSAWGLCAGDRIDSEQSPIDIRTKDLLTYGRGVFWLPISYNTSSYSAWNTGRSVSLIINNPESNTLTVDGKVFSLRRIAFHTPSHHTIDGYHADLEAEFLHSSSDGSHAGIAVLFNRTGDGKTRSEWISEFEFYLPEVSDCSHNNFVEESVIGEQCDDGYWDSDSKPNRCRLNGRIPHVGDGVVDRGEQCDDGSRNSFHPNACRPNGWLPYCGDGILDRDEECDFNITGGPPCTFQCKLLCGDGELEGNETCDNGTWNSNHLPNACRKDCRLPWCGDGVTDWGEQCDDGIFNSNTTSGSCRTNCRLPKCGDGVIDYSYDEYCDDGAQNGLLGNCLSNCTHSCGSGILLPGSSKQCDNGTRNSNTDGQCRTNCMVPVCGDGIIDRSLGEECDPGSPLPTIFCSSQCKNLCGNGKIDNPPVALYPEACDEGEMNDDYKPNGCRTNCQLYFCGDGVKDAGEECDLGALNGNVGGAACRTTCVLPRCGDGIVDPSEDCDDGGFLNGDGCSATCLFECGNGRRDGYEECDDGCENSEMPNSCRPQGFIFGGCKNPACGDGIVDDGEQCDDGPLNNDNLPNRCRTNCQLPYCGDGVTDTNYGEKCDRGQNNDDFSGICSSTCILNACRRVDPPSGRVLKFNNLFDLTSPVIKYWGSLLYPPCSEDVQWFVLQKTNPISTSQLEEFTRRLKRNIREVQPLNGRNVIYTASEGPVCGNCVVEEGEECDQGFQNGDSTDKCRNNCRKPRCGDGIVDTGEQCDDGKHNSNHGPCGHNCNWVTSCPARYQKKKNESSNIIGGNVINVNFADLLKD